MSPIALSSAPAPTTELPLTDFCAELMTALDVYEVAPSHATRASIAALRRSYATTIAGFEGMTPQSPLVRAALDAVRRLAAAAIADEPLANDDYVRLADFSRQGWLGLIAAMVMVPASRWSDAPLLSQVPDWMWADYAEWLFSAPIPFASQADATAHASHLGRHTEELARWVTRNIGSPTVRVAADAYLRYSSLAAFHGWEVDFHKVAEARGRILTRLLTRETARLESYFIPRVGRGLRIGFVAERWDASAATSLALARFEHLTSPRFDVVLFSLEEPLSGFGEYCRSKATDFRVLYGEGADQVAEIRAANLDVVIFAGDVTRASTGLGRLALQRLAPVQGLFAEVAGTSGLADMDIVIAGEAHKASVDRFSERMVLVKGPSPVFALQRGTETDVTYTREDLGIPADVVVVGTVVRSATLSTATLATWATILAAAPRAHLLVHLVPELSGGSVEKLQAALQPILAENGVEPTRITLWSPAQITASEKRALIRLTNLFLATAGDTASVVEALLAGIPVLGTDAATLALLEAEHLPHMAADEADKVAGTAVALINNDEQRQSLAEQISEAVQAGLGCLDTLAATDAFAVAIETAFDRIEADGPNKFRRQRNPILVPEKETSETLLTRATAALEASDLGTASDLADRALNLDPRCPQTRVLVGRVALAQSRPDRASAYLLAAVGQIPADAELWFTLSKSLREEGKLSEAVQALEAALRLDPRRVDGWFSLLELADACGSDEFARGAYDVLKELAPEDPRVADLGLRFAL